MAKIRVDLQVDGSVEAQHIDEVPTNLLRELIIPQMHEIGYDSTSIIQPQQCFSSRLPKNSPPHHPSLRHYSCAINNKHYVL